MSRTTLLLALASVASPSIAQRVRVDYDHGRNLSCYRTYRWVGFDNARPSSADFPNQLMQHRIVGFVEAALSVRHVTRVERDSDLLVAYDMKVTELPQFTTISNGIGPGWGGGWGWNGWGCCGWAGGWSGAWDSEVSTTTMQTFLMGTLIVDMTDARQKLLIFQGVSKATISSRPDKNVKRLQKGIDEMFEKYPHKN
jgi:Domain of unknown function (DUF4136)